jgi:hypothetical protein
MDELAELLERFRRGPELFASSLIGAAGPELDYRPAPDQWSVRQIASHLADSELVGAMRFRQVIAEDSPHIENYDEKAWAEKLDYSRRKTSQCLETFRRVRGESYELLKELPQETFSRAGRHSTRGPMTLLEMLRIYAVHAEKHSEQIRRVRQAYKASKAPV